MEAKELRIGNYINYLGTVNIVESIAGTEESYVATKSSGIMPVNAFQPIILTEGWLLKLGFEKNIMCPVYEKNKETIQIEIVGPIVYFRIFVPNFGFIAIQALEFVHQLQNLYFALTGEELTQQ